MRTPKATLCTFVAAGLMALSPALACTCSPFEGDAKAHADEYDFIGMVEVETIFDLKSDAEEKNSAALRAFYDGLSDVMEAHIEAIEAGEDVPSLDELQDEYYENSSYRPPPYIVTSTLTHMKVKRVLKGEKSSAVFVRSSSPGNPACGVSYRPDAEIFLFAKGGEGLYSTRMCSGPRFSFEDYEAALAGD